MYIQKKKINFFFIVEMESQGMTNEDNTGAIAGGVVAAVIVVVIVVLAGFFIKR